MSQKENIIYIDILRIFAAFAVIMLHTSAKFLSKMAENNVHFLQGNLFDSATRWCVPIFFMISGALLLNSKRDFNLTFFLKKRFSKILIPFLFFSVFYYLFFYRNLDVSQFFLSFANHDIAYHLWFFYALISVYLFAPILILFVKQSNEKINIFILIVWFLLCSLVPFLNSMIPTLQINFFGTLGIYLGYFLLGYLLFTKSFVKWQRFLIYGLGLLSFLITFFGTYIFTKKYDGNFFGNFYEYNSPNVLIMAIAIFILFKYACNFKMKNTKVLAKISSLTFGVYLIHPFFLFFFSWSKYLNFLFEDHLLITIPFISIVVFILSIISSLIISKIPILKKVI